MNSMSKRKYEYSKKEEITRCNSFIKCGFPRSITIPAATAVDTTFTLTSFNLDTSCICDPRIKLDFEANLITTGFTGALSIQGFKQCRNQLLPTPVGPNWVYTETATTTAAETFSFFNCDEDSCSDGECCTYTVVATVTTVTAGILAINNATLVATVTCGENQCHKRGNCYY